MFCIHCGSHRGDGEHYGVEFVNGYPSPCRNNGKTFFECRAFPILTDEKHESENAKD